MTKILLSLPAAQQPDLWGAGTHSTEFSSSQLQTKASLGPFHPLAPKQPRAGEAAQASPKTLWHRPRAQPRLSQHQSQTAAQAAFSILHTFIRFRAGQITKCTKWRPHTTRSRIVGCSSIPMAQKHLVEVWRGQAGSGSSNCQLHLDSPRTRPCSHPDRAQLTHTPWDSGATSPICLERTDWLKPAVGRGKCSKDLKCCATHIHTSKSLNPHHLFWSQTFPRQDSILTTLQEIRWW